MSTCINCDFNSPCFCLATATTPEPSCPSGSECCLKACNGVVYCENGVGPCGAVGTYDLSLLSHNTTGCKDSVKFYLEKWDDTFFDSVSLTTAGVLTWTTGDESTVDKYSEVCFRMKCTAKDACADCVTLNSLGYVNIGIKNLCTAQECTVDGEECNLCTGGCEPTAPDVEIT